MRHKNNKAVSAGALVLSFALLFSACGKQEEALTAEPASSNVAVTTEQEEIETPKGPASLLTNEVSDKDLSNVRPLAVMIENTKPALPHYGLCDAGVVYEMPEEGGITRYMALYDQYEGYERIGNIRSARPYFCLAADEYKAILAHVGQSVYAEYLLKSMSSTGIVDDVNGVLGNTSYIRTSDKNAPHNTYLTSEKIIKDIENHGFDRNYSEPYAGHFKFAKEENLLEYGTDCTEVHVYFYNNKPYFIYDPETKLYTRYAFGAKEQDALSSDGLQYTNLIIQQVDSQTHKNDVYIDMDVRTYGQGKYLTRGKMIDILWAYSPEENRTLYCTPDGEEIELNTGKTFISVCETSGIDGNTYE